MSTVPLACASCRAENPTPVSQLLSRLRCQRCNQALLTSTPVEVTRDTVSGILRGSPLPVLLVLYSPWQPQSAMVTPVLTQVAQRHGTRLLILKLNADLYPDVAKSYNAPQLPTLVLFKGGTERGRLPGTPSISDLERLVGG